MKTSLIVLTGIVALGASLQASTSFSFQATNFVDSTGAAQTFVGVGTQAVTATVTAYSASAYTASDGVNPEPLTTASIGTYGAGYGLGVCNSADDGGSTCTSPQHQIDNSGSTDFVLISFSTAVSLQSIQLGFFGSDSTSDLTDMSYWTNVATTVVNGVLTYGTTSTSTTHTNVAEATSVSTIGETTISCTASGTYACPTNNNSVTYNSGDGFTGGYVTNLLISAQYAAGISAANKNDSFFKIESLTVGAATATPEPASFILIGSGLLAGALFSRRRRTANSNA